MENSYFRKRTIAVVFLTLSVNAFGQKQDSVKSKEIDGVVVIGYGTQKKAKISGAVTEAKLDKLTSRSLSGVSSALQGKAAGVTVVNEGGDPTSTPKVNIRGLGGLNGENPLYVVDGVVFDGVPSINPNDIESISVLKDSFAAIYGARASGGVILITTKKGSKGTVSLEFDSKFGVMNAWKLRKSLNAAEFQDVMTQAYANVGKQDNLPDAFDPNKYPDGRITRTDWIDEIFRTGQVQEYNLNLSGGGEKSRFFMGMNQRSIEGILLNTQAKRYNFRINSDHKIRPWLKIGENMYYNYSDGNTANTTNGYTGAILAAMYYPSNVPVYDDNGNFSGLPLSVAGSYGDVINPVAYLKRITYKNPHHEILINPYIEVNLFKGLKFKSNFSQTFNISTVKDFTKRVIEIGKIFDFNKLSQSSTFSSSLLSEQIITYNNRFGNHTIDATLGYTFQKYVSEWFLAEGRNFKNEEDHYQYLINANSNKEINGGKYSTALISTLSRLNYDYDRKYMISVLGRRDGSSMVAKKNRFEFYYAISGAWMMSRENFMKDIDWLSMFKFRGSYGVLGNLGGISYEAVNPTMKRDNNVIFGDPASQNTGYYSTIYPNPDLKWGSSEQTNYGIDVGFFNNRLSINADYFIKNSKDQIFQRDLPSTSGGYEVTYINSGLFQDKGFELGLNYNTPRNRDFTYSFNANLAILESKVKEMPIDRIHLGTHVRHSLKPSWIIPGYPLYSFYGFKTKGLFQNKQEINNHKDASGNLIQPDAEPGDIIFLKKEGSVGNLGPDDMTYLGNPYPKFSYSFSHNITWKNFDLNLFFQGVHGNKIFNGLKFITMSMGSGQNYNLDRDILKSWTPENPNTNIPRLAIGDPSSNYSRVSDFYIEDGSYLRLKNLTLGYTVPRDLSSAITINKVRVYITIDNLLTFTKYSGFDPEIGMNNNGIDIGRYPQARSYIFGVTLGF